MKTEKIFAVLTMLFVIFAAAGIAEAEAFPEFSTKDLGGGGVTNEIFAENKITMINFWATWCPPCVAEMPDLGELHRQLPDGAGLIGILVDAGDKGAILKAGQILNKAEARFPQLCAGEDMNGILAGIEAIPTTIFVDSQGNIVGEPIVGANSKDFYLDAVKEALE